MKKIETNLKYVHEFRDRHGKLRRYLRRPGENKIPLPGEPGSPEFMRAYYGAPTAKENPGKPKPRKPGVLPGSLNEVISAYYRDSSFTVLSPVTQQMRRAVLEQLRRDDGMKPFALLHEKAIRERIVIRKPFAQRNWLKAFRGLMKFAVAHGLRTDDPTQGLEKHLTQAKGGHHHTWTEAEIEKYEKRHPIGTMARLAMALMLYTGQRKSDTVHMGPRDLGVEPGKIMVRQRKTGMEKADERLLIPVHPQLARVLNETPVGHLCFLVTEYGASFASAASFGNKMRDWCDQAGLPDCSSHGLRKAMCRRLAQAGCSAPQIAAISGHKTLAEVQRYIEEANRDDLAEDAMAKITAAPEGQVISLQFHERNTRRTKIGQP
jgi:integrase